MHARFIVSRLVIGAVAVALAGCGSSPKTQYFTLSPVTPQGATATVAIPIQVSAVHIPATLDRTEIVSATGPNALDISSQSRWSAPLGVMMRRVLSQDLAALLPPGRVILPDEPAPSNAEQIVVTVAEFGPEPEGKIRLEADWTVVAGNSLKPILRRSFSRTVGANGAGATGAAAGMSDLLGALASEIAQALSARS